MKTLRILLTSLVLTAATSVALAETQAENAAAPAEQATNAAPAAAEHGSAYAEKATATAKVSKEEIKKIRKECAEKNPTDKAAAKKCVSDAKKELASGGQKAPEAQGGEQGGSKAPAAN